MSRSSGSGPGRINVGGDAHLYFDGTQTISNATINLGNSFDRGYLRETDTAGAGNQVLTLASNVTIEVNDCLAGIASGSAPGDGIINDGTIDVFGVAGDLIINPTTFANNGTIDVATVLKPVNIKTAVTGKGKDKIHSGILQFDAVVSTAATLGDQNVDFAGAGELRLFDPVDFYGEISGFGARDQINLAILNSGWLFSGISHTADVTTLTLSDGTTTHSVEFAGDYARSDFSIHTQRNGVTAIKYV
jgi:hypothetical protein